MIHLDTSILIRMLKRGPAEARLLEAAAPDEPVVVSAVAWTDFLCGPIGPAKEELASRIVGDHHNLTFEHVGIAARLFNDSGRRRSSRSDFLIAAVAIHDGARLATSNLADFRRFASAGLKLL